MEHKGKVLIVDDEEDMLENCQLILQRFGHQVVTCQDSRKALEIAVEFDPQVVLTDLRMPHVDGLNLLQQFKKARPHQIIILFTAFASVESAVQAVKEGAYDYLPKPFSVDQLNLVVQRALHQQKLIDENENLRTQLQNSFNHKEIIASSRAMDRVFRLVEKAAKSEANILITGESGTGKEMVARKIYTNSNRNDKPFVPIDCASIPENLMESELFGHEKGAFTGALGAKVGLFELAHEGTLFLDEIGELSLPLQAKLLRVLQEQQLRRIGGTKLIDVNVRIIAATNRDLLQMVEAKEFREDLYYRLNVVTVSLPPLRERPEDITLLSTHFCKLFSAQNNRPKLKISDETMEILLKYLWPGNVRELQNVIERAVILAEGDQIRPGDLPDNIGLGECPKELDFSYPLPFHEAKERWLRNFEKGYLASLLNRHQGNISKAAKDAGVDRKTIHRLLKKYNLEA